MWYKQWLGNVTHKTIGDLSGRCKAVAGSLAGTEVYRAAKVQEFGAVLLYGSSACHTLGLQYSSSTDFLLATAVLDAMDTSH